ncbi:hypothetical protein GIB67_032307, partial [Kingdonia uniflora]
SFLGASVVLRFFAIVYSLPFDYVKTQIQKMQPDATEKYPYKYSLDCAMKTLKARGPFNFYTGFFVYSIRIAPHVMVIKEAEQSFHDAIMIIRRALKNSTVVVGAGAMNTTMKFTLIGENRISALARSQNLNQQILSRSSSRLSFHDEFDDSKFSCLFAVDDDDLTDPGLRYDGDSTIAHRLNKEITKVELVKMKGKGSLKQPTNSYQYIIVTEVESFKQIGLEIDPD